MRTVLKFYVCLNPFVYPMYPLDTQKTRDFDLRQGRAMARRKSGEALLTQWQVASCKLPPWFSDNFCWPFWNWSWNWQGRIPADEAWPEWYEFGLPTPVLVQGFSTRRTVQLYIFITKPTKVRQFSIPVGCSKTLPTQFTYPASTLACFQERRARRHALHAAELVSPGDLEELSDCQAWQILPQHNFFKLSLQIGSDGF